MGSGSGDSSFNPYPFLDGSQPATILQGAATPGAAAIGSPCFQVGFPWWGTKTAEGTCKPVLNVSPVAGVLVTTLILGTLFFKAVKH